MAVELTLVVSVARSRSDGKAEMKRAVRHVGLRGYSVGNDTTEQN